MFLKLCSWCHRCVYVLYSRGSYHPHICIRVLFSILLYNKDNAYVTFHGWYTNRSAATIEMSLAADSKRKTDSTLSERKRKNRATQTQNKAHYTNAHGPKSIRTGVLIFGLIYMMERSVSGTTHSFTNDHETQNDHIMISILLFRTQLALNNWLGH